MVTMPPAALLIVTPLGAEPLILPARVSVEPLAPVPAIDQVCGAPSTTGAVMEILPALLCTAIPSVETAGAIVSVLMSGPPPPMETEVTPVGVEVNTRPPTVNGTSSVEA